MDDVTATEMAVDALAKVGYGPRSVATILMAIHEAGLLIIEPNSFNEALVQKFVDAGLVVPS